MHVLHMQLEPHLPSSKHVQSVSVCSPSPHFGVVEDARSRCTLVAFDVEFHHANGCQYKLATKCATPTSRGSLACGMTHTPPLRLSFQTMRNQTRHDAGYVHDPSEFLIVTALAIMWWFGKSTKVTPRTVACLTCDVIGRACVRTSAIHGNALNGP